MFKKDDNRDFCLVQNITLGEADFNQLMRFKNQLVNAAEDLGRQENFSPVLTYSEVSKDIDEQFKLAHKVVDVLNRPYGKTFVTLLRYKVDKRESVYAQVRG